MNHEEHVNQLKSEVRYIQEVLPTRGALVCAAAAAMGVLAVGSGLLCFPQGVPQGSPSPAVAPEPQPHWQTGSGAEPSCLLTCLHRAVV